MSSKKFESIPQTDRWSYAWLALGFILSFFITGRWTIAAAVWLAPVFLMRFMRTQKAWKGFLLIAIASSIAMVFTWQGLMPFPPPQDVVMLIVIGVTGSILLLIDRLLVTRWQRSGRNPFATTLIYPFMMTAFEFLTVEGNPMGSFGASAYTQFGLLPLLQIMSITGMWGVTFLLSWFPAIINWMWEHHFQWQAIKRGTAVYAGIMLVVLLFGTIRLWTSPKDVETVSIAGVTAVPLDMGYLNSLSWEELRQETQQRHEQYFTASEPLVTDGAQLILWPEAAAVVTAEDEATLMQEAAEFANEHNVYMGIPTLTLHQNADHYENELRIIAPSTETILTHRKYGGHQFEIGSVPGDGILNSVETPLGALAGTICWDTDFPSTVAQIGRNGTDILLSPSKDDIILPMSDLHGEMATFRAIENGVSVIRQADGGTSMFIDPYGRVISKTPYQANASVSTTAAAIPTQGVATIYSQVGDLFGWLSIVGFAFVILWAIIAGRKTATVENESIQTKNLGDVVLH